MREFSPLDRGNAPQRWQAEPWWNSALEVGLPPAGTRIVALAAHPDDESLGIGGFLHAAAGAGLALTVILATDGEASHPQSPTHPPERIAALRRPEFAAAVRRLAPDASIVRLALPDGRLMDCVQRLSDELAQLLGEDRDTWLLSTWREDGHPDHTACALAARQATAARTRTRCWEYPVWLWHAGDPVELRPRLSRDARRFALDVEDIRARDEALACYASQLQPLSAAAGDEAVLPVPVRAHAARDRDVLLDPGSHASAAAGYFAGIYDSAEDPWRFGASWYERRKRALLMAALPRERFRRTFEPGCARGDLTLALADRSDGVLAVDWAPAALAVARRRLQGRPGVQVQRARIPEDWPDGPFDLIVLSEIAYYLPDLAGLARLVLQSLSEQDGVVVLLHWRRAAPDHQHTAETVHLALRSRLGLATLVHHEEDDFLLDVLSRDRQSVAARENEL